MELTVAKADLQRELQLCQGIVEKRSTIPILSNVLLRAAGDRLEIAATDLDVTFQTSSPAGVRAEGSVTVEARRFFDIIRSLPQDEVRIRLADSDKLSIESGTAKFEIAGLPSEDYPTLPKVPETGGFTIRLEDLRGMVEKVVFAITHEETRFQLNGALLKILPDRMEMVATDGYRLALVQLPQESRPDTENLTDPVTLVIPRKALHEIMKLESSGDIEVTFGTSENHLFFRTGGRLLTARVLDVNFPNYDEVVAKDNDKRVLVDRVTLLEAIRRVSIVANERTRAVKFNFSAGSLVISSANPELRGSATEQVAIDYSGETFHVGLNAVYVQDFLNVVDTSAVTLELKDENSQCLAKPFASDTLPYDYLYVVMPMRIA